MMRMDPTNINPPTSIIFLRPSQSARGAVIKAAMAPPKI